MWKDLNHFVIEVIAFGSFAVSIGSLLIEEMLGKVARRRGTCYFWALRVLGWISVCRVNLGMLPPLPCERHISVTVFESRNWRFLAVSCFSLR